jgi:hypothetical protein
VSNTRQEASASENLIETECSLTSMTKKDSEMNSNPITSAKSSQIYDILREGGMNKGATAATLSYIGDIRLLGLLDKWTEVTCADGSKARILKDPADAFELYAKEWTAKFTLVIDLLNKIKTEGDITVNNKVVKLFDNLNYVNAALQEMYKNSYLTFAAMPCSESAQAEKRKMDRITAAIGLSLVGIKVLLEDSDNHNIGNINSEVLKLIDRLISMLESN